MVLSDTLSRRSDAEELKEKSRIETLLPPHLFVNLLDAEFSLLLKRSNHSEYDPSVLERLRFLEQEDDAEDPEWRINKDLKGETIIYYKEKKYVPRNMELRRQLLKEYHDHETAGHPGVATTYYLLSRDYWWPGMSTFVKEYVKGCHDCQQMKINR